MPQTVKDILSAPIPLSVVAFLIMQTMGFVWWSSAQLNAITLRITMLEMNEQTINKTQDARASHEGRLIALEQQWSRIRDDLTEIKTLVRGEKMGSFDAPPSSSPARKP